jgi:hypothetical protein
VTTVADDLIGIAHDADNLVHEVADLGYLERHGMAGEALHDHLPNGAADS